MSRKASGGLSSPTDPQQEITAIRSEFSALMSDVNREAEMEALKRDAKDELQHAYAELDSLHSRLKRERAERQRLEKELQYIASGRGSGEGELARKTEELEKAQEERAKMKLWLDRGVAECKRVADEALQVRRELKTAESTSAALEAEKEKMTLELKTLTEDLVDLRHEVEALEAEKKLLATKLESFGEKMADAEERHRQEQNAAMVLQAECARLAERVKHLDRCEECLLDTCNNIADLIDEIQLLDRNISEGKFGASALTDLRLLQDCGKNEGRHVRYAKRLHSVYQPSLKADIPTPSPHKEPRQDPDEARRQFAKIHGEEPSGVTSGRFLDYEEGVEGGPSIEDARQLLHALSQSIHSLTLTTYKFVNEKSSINQEERKQHTEELQKLQKDKELLLQQHEAEKEQLRARCRALEEEIVNFALSVEGAPQEEEEPPVTNAERARVLKILDAACKEYSELESSIEGLKAEKARWTALAKKRKIDWVKVNASRQRYQELVQEMDIMKDYKERLRHERDELILAVEHHMQRACETPAEREARLYREAQQDKINRAAFDEWKSNLQRRNSEHMAVTGALHPPM